MIAVRYAKALYELAQEKNLLDKVFQDIQSIAAILKRDTSLQNFLENPVVKGEQKKELLKSAFNDKVQPMVSSLLSLLVDKRRESFLFAICIAFIQIYKEKEGYSEVIFTTAMPAAEEAKSILQKQLSEKLKMKVDLKTVVDENLIGGFKLRIDDMLMDKSIATQLENFKKELLSK